MIIKQQDLMEDMKCFVIADENIYNKSVVPLEISMFEWKRYHNGAPQTSNGNVIMGPLY